ncbi:SDR family NAD(P)-dependent oxidoreductase [Paenibacillus campi]|uniref:SDR family NAD(P)-dependent oxidoreductase n=1 Tax=Paenibacillus campi TaxID=3106031 RepID=UPI002AFEEFEC|nr:SDR family NAD(P)-dependent oxidoreductase [Paenibacillus sp. SGZ-1009]
MMPLQGKCIFITGASRGIGRQTAVTLAEHGARLVLAARSDDALHTLRQELEHRYDAEVLTIAYDVTDEDQTKAAFRQTKQTFGSLDGLVNNAGILESRLLGMMDDTTIQRTLQTNLVAALTHLQYAARLMKPKRSGSIVNLSSIMGRYGSEGHVLYAASKAGLIGATVSAAKELAPYQIRVNAVAPGFIDTDMTTGLTVEKYQERLQSIRMGRVGTAIDVANLIWFLCSDLSAYVTGQTIGVDGGMII